MIKSTRAWAVGRTLLDCHTEGQISDSRGSGDHWIPVLLNLLGVRILLLVQCWCQTPALRVLNLPGTES